MEQGLFVRSRNSLVNNGENCAYVWNERLLRGVGMDE